MSVWYVDKLVNITTYPQTGPYVFTRCVFKATVLPCAVVTSETHYTILQSDSIETFAYYMIMCVSEPPFEANHAANMYNGTQNDVCKFTATTSNKINKNNITDKQNK